MHNSSLEIQTDRMMLLILELRDDVRKLLASSSRSSKRWISTSEFSKELNCSSRTITGWITAGKLPPSVYKKKSRGAGHVYLLDREPALKAAERIMTT